MALNDPNWGRRGDGPPDLDEIWNRFRQKIPGLFGGKGGGRGPAGAKRFPGGAWLLIVLVAVIWLASGFYIVDASQRGVVLRFGRYAQTTEPGPQWHLPYPVESVEIVNLSQVRTLEIGYRNSVKDKRLKESLMLTDDENIVDLQLAVQYVLKDPTEFLFFNRDVNEDAVRQVAESAIREIVGKSKMDFVLYEGREVIRAQAQKLIQEMLDRYKTGIQISQVTLQQTQPPEDVQAAFNDAVKANQDRERQISEGQAYANDVVPKARGSASRLMQESEGYKQRIIATAEGEASRFRQILTEYSRAPAVTRERMYIDAVQQVLSNTSKVIVDQKSGNSLLFLPLDKLLQLSASTALAPPENAERSPAAEMQSQAVPTVDPRSRESFRSRDREPRP